MQETEPKPEALLSPVPAPELIEMPADMKADMEAQAAEQAAARAAAEAARPSVEPIKPMPGTDPEQWTTPPEGSSGVMQETGGYTNLNPPSEAQRLENERLMTEAAGQPVETPQVPEVPEVQ